MREETRTRTVSATAQWPLVVLCIAGAIAGTAGVYWDLGWHYDRGRDTVLSAPHLLIGLGSMVLGLAVALWSVILHRRCRRDARIVLPVREYGGISYSPLLLITLIAALVPPTALSIDEAWHQLFGLDTSLWSPTHLLAIIAGPVAMIAVSALLAWEMNQTDPDRARAEVRSLRGLGLAGMLAIGTFAGVAVTLLLPWAEYDFDLPQWDLTLAPPLLVAMLAFPTFLAAETIGRQWTATLVLGCVAVLRLGITGFVMAADQTAPDIVVPVLAGVVVDLIVISGSRTLRGWTLAIALMAFPVAVIASEAARLSALGQEKWLEGLLPLGGVAALAAGVLAGYLGALAGRWMRPAGTRPEPRSGESVAETRVLPRRARTGVATGLVCALMLAPAPAGGVGTAPTDHDKVMVPARMTLSPGEPRAGEPVTIRVTGFEDARLVNPKVPTGEKVERTSSPAPFLEDQRRDPQLIAYYAGTWLRVPLERRGKDAFEATLTFPDDGNWRMGPFFYLGDYRWTERISLQVADTGDPAGAGGTRTFPLELAAEGDPVDAPTWLKPIGFALLGALFLAAVWLVVVQLRIVRSGGIATA